METQFPARLLDGVLLPPVARDMETTELTPVRQVHTVDLDPLDGDPLVQAFTHGGYAEYVNVVGVVLVIYEPLDRYPTVMRYLSLALFWDVDPHLVALGVCRQFHSYGHFHCMVVMGL
tara:strand:- start:120 stop:473 length:354 start_codon:yes stop_codon:yes gene_type:complete